MRAEQGPAWTSALGMILGLSATVLVICMFWLGLPRFNEVFSPWLIGITPPLILVDFAILLPLSLSSRFREWAFPCMVAADWTFMAVLWFEAVILTFFTLRWFWLIVGLAFGGVGVVPLAIIGAAIRGYWPEFFLMVGLVALVAVSKAAIAFALSRVRV